MLSEFLRALFEHGRLRLERSPAVVSDADAPAAHALILEWEAANRLEFPGLTPELSLPAAYWAAGQFYRACEYAIFREVSVEEIKSSLSTPCPSAEGAAQHYSVDLVFRFLPDLYRIVRAASEDDPLCQHVRDWAEMWPLSSVGITGIVPRNVDRVCGHAGLLALYVDRILAKNDTSRLADKRVSQAVRAALGHFGELAPNVSRVIATS